ncbi:MAG: CusA/CzcA family heavy metal efflux RND transporter [Flavobacteriales bacterium]|nr:CusA/CzcA family heavy metal efflux RND transporter [Flavobacteriales bacterium]
MLDKIIGFSIKNKLVIGLMMLALIAWGSYAVKQLPIDAVPDITNNQVQVITITPSLAAQEIEKLITFPVEITMATIPGIEEIRSFSRFGLSVVTIVFEEDVDVYWARQQVNERLSEAKSQIPNGIGTPSMAPVTTGLGEIYQYVVRAKEGYEDKYSAMELRTIQDWIIKRQLLGTPGVAEVSSFGGYLKQYEISVDPEKLRSMNISISDIFTALEKNNQNTGGAYIDKQPNAYFIRSEGLIGNIEDIENIVIKNNSSGTPILVRDAASVRYGHAIRYGASTRNGEGEVVSAIVMMLKGENSAKVITNIKDRIAQIQKTLPEGVVIEPFLDRTKLVNNAIGTVAKNLIEGALIVIFILILMLGNVRAGIVVASVIPLAMLFAFGMMHLFGVSGNLMSLGAIDFGLIVDGAVIIVESIVHRITMSKHHHVGVKKLNREQMNTQVYESAKRMMSSASFGQIIIFIVYMPILALVGVEGKMFKPMAQTVSFAILGAFVLSLTYVPMVSALFLSRKTEHKRNISDKLVDFFQRIYSSTIDFALNRKLSIIVTTVILFFMSLFIFSNMGGEFIPTLDEGDFAVETRVMTGSSLSQTIEATTKAQKVLLKFPEVKQVVGKIGSGEIPTDPMPVEAADLMIILKDKNEWTTAKTREELAEKMSEALSVIPGVTFGFQQPIQMRFNELMTGARQDVVIKIYGEDLDLLSNYANKVGKLVKTVEGAEDLYVEQVTGLPQIQITYNRATIAKYGLNIQDVNAVIETAFAGKSAGMVYEGERKFDLVIRFDKEHRKDIENVSNLFISTPDGHQIPLNQVAEVAFKNGPNQIQRDDTKRRITVGFNVRNRDVESTVEEIKNKINKKIDFSAGYYPTYGGQFENLVEARKRLSIAVPVALLLIFILLFFTFKSMKQSLLIFTAIPLSAIGGIFALYFRGMPFSISAGIGFIALFGVAVLNGIVLIAEFNRLKTEGVDLTERVLKGTKTRLRPVLMTAMVASFGFLPMALSSSSGAEVQRPLATVVIGGLISATLLTLIVLPILYIYFEKGIKKVKANSPLILIGLILIPALSFSQNTTKEISIEEAIKIALENNQKVKSAELEVKYNQKLKKTSTDFGKTQLDWQHGQYNSYIKNDNYFAVSQSFAFPTVYINNSKVANANIKSSEYKQAATKNELVAEVKTTYYNLLYAQSNFDLLIRLDSLFSDFAKAATLKYKTGESNLLEKTTAETQSMEVKNQLQLAKSDVEIYKYQLKTLLNSNDLFAATTSTLKKEITLSLDSNLYSNNPVLAYLQQEIMVEKEKKSLETAKLLPEFTVGYFNQSLTGSQTINGVNQYFGPSNRFSGFQVGVAIPLWFRPHTAKIQAANVQADIAESNYLHYEKTLDGMYQQAIQVYLKHKNSLNYYEKSALSQSELILKNAQKGFSAGEVGYVEYVQAVLQGVQIQSGWLQALNNYNQAIIRLEFLAGIN